MERINVMYKIKDVFVVDYGRNEDYLICIYDRNNNYMLPLKELKIIKDFSVDNIYKYIDVKRAYSLDEFVSNFWINNELYRVCCEFREEVKGNREIGSFRLEEFEKEINKVKDMNKVKRR